MVLLFFKVFSKIYKLLNAFNPIVDFHFSAREWRLYVGWPVNLTFWPVKSELVWRAMISHLFSFF